MFPTIAILALSFFFQTPDTTVPVSAHAEYTVAGRGVQIYKCTVKDLSLIHI